MASTLKGCTLLRPRTCSGLRQPALLTISSRRRARPTNSLTHPSAVPCHLLLLQHRLGLRYAALMTSNLGCGRCSRPATPSDSTKATRRLRAWGRDEGRKYDTGGDQATGAHYAVRASEAQQAGHGTRLEKRLLPWARGAGRSSRPGGKGSTQQQCGGGPRSCRGRRRTQHCAAAPRGAAGSLPAHRLTTAALSTLPWPTKKRRACQGRRVNKCRHTHASCPCMHHACGRAMGRGGQSISCHRKTVVPSRPVVRLLLAAPHQGAPGPGLPHAWRRTAHPAYSA